MKDWYVGMIGGGAAAAVGICINAVLMNGREFNVFASCAGAVIGIAVTCYVANRYLK